MKAGRRISMKPLNITRRTISLAVILCASAISQAQVYAPTRLFYNNTAELGPGYSLGVVAGTSILDEEQNVFYGNASATLAGLLEIEVGNLQLASSLFGVRKPIYTWGLKIPLWGSREQLPAIALAIRSSLEWTHDALLEEDMQRLRRDLTWRGLESTGYDFRLTTASILFSERLHKNLMLHGGIGAQEVQYRNLFLFLEPNDYYRNLDLHREFLLSGYLGANVQVHPRFTVVGEVESVPHFDTRLETFELVVDRSYVWFLGIRFLIDRPVAFDAGIRYNKGPNAPDTAQLVMALSALLSIR